jgi:transcriptional regulator with XRE-family HTH domain
VSGGGAAEPLLHVMHATLGGRARRHRERQGIALSTIAEKTKIKQSMLEGLERDDISQWPVGIFRRAYARSYACAIGLDADAFVREFLARYPEPIEPAEAPAASRSRLRGLVDAALAPLNRRPTAVPAGVPLPAPAREPDLIAAANLCTELGRVERSDQLPSLLREAARILDATGVVVWVWDAMTAELKPVLVHGYPDRLKARLGAVQRDAANITAVAFRTAQTCVVKGGEEASGALAVPILTAAACAGVLAIELPHGAEQAPAVRAIATFLAAMLAQVISLAPRLNSRGST